MTSFSRLREGARVALLVVATGLACSSGGDGGTGPSPNSSLGGLSSAMSDVSTKYLGPNAAALNSLEYFSPYISTLFPAPPPPGGVRAGSAAALAGCLPVVVQGVTYDFNDQTLQYEPTQATGAPADGFRTLLYQVQSGNLVVPKQQIGYMDVSCSSTLPAVDLTVSTVVSGIEILNLHGVGTVNVAQASLNVNATLTAQPPAGGTPLSVDNNFSGSVISSVSGVALDLPGFINIGYSRTLTQGSTTSFVAATGGDPQVALDWMFFLGMDVTSGDITDGSGPGAAPALFSDFMTPKVVACFSGPEANPIVSNATGAPGCTSPGEDTQSLSAQQLAGLKAAYQTILTLHGIATGFWQLTVQILA